jgi:hypothetical protein
MGHWSRWEYMFYESCEHDAQSVELLAKDKTNIMIPVFKVYIVSYSHVSC